jgi:hypothetical protein
MISNLILLIDTILGFLVGLKEYHKPERNHGTLMEAEKTWTGPTI